MHVLTRFFLFLYSLIETAVARIRWPGLSVDGLFRKRHDTEITITKKGKICIGKHVYFQRDVSISSVGGNFQIGDNVGFNRHCIAVCRNEIIISEGVIMGPGVTIYDHDHVFSNEGIQKDYKLGSVIIERGCWIAANVTVLRDTHVGEGCVIGAGVVLQGDIPAHSLVTGNRELNIIPLTKLKVEIENG